MRHPLIFLIFWLFSTLNSTAQIDITESYKDLFPAVQLSDIFEDSKTFPDCTPLQPPKVIMSNYLQYKEDSNFVLREFIFQNFSSPESFSSPVVYTGNTPAKDITDHLTHLWKTLERPADTISTTSLIPLPNPYIVPGGRFREIYYWDS